MNTKAPNAIDIHVGSRMRMRRLMLGISQSRLAEHLGVTFQQVQKYEKGMNRIGASRLQKIAELLAAPPSYFFQRDDAAHLCFSEFEPLECGDRIAEFLHSREGLALNRAFLKIQNATLREGLVSLVKAIAQAEGHRKIDIDVAKS